MNIVVIGGAGVVRSMVLDPLRDRHQVRVVDRSPDVELVEADVTDPVAIARAVAGRDVLVYLAMGALPTGLSRLGRHPFSGPAAATQFDLSVKGLYLTLGTAGPRPHVVYASSLSLRELPRARPPAGGEHAGRLDGCGLIKRLGEEVCCAAVTEHGINVTALRLCGPMPDGPWALLAEDRPEIMTAGSDVVAAILAAINVAPPGTKGLLVTGEHEQRYLAWSRTRYVLGWEPRTRC